MSSNDDAIESVAQNDTLHEMLEEQDPQEDVEDEALIFDTCEAFSSFITIVADPPSS